jgi:AcrR family transcriptional regulator
MSDVGEQADSLDLVQTDCQTFGRPAAGEDPVKREQILDGAHRVFMRLGFDAASMNDITREAGVSKGTLYVYFKNKEDLFVAMIARQKQRIFSQMREVLDKGLPVHDTLHDWGVLFSTHLLSEKTIRGMRIVIGVIDRIPDLAGNFLAMGPGSGPVILANYLEKQVELGNLKDLEDPMRAGRQFSDLCLTGLFRNRLFGEMKEPPSKEQIEANVASAIRVFMNTYGV